MDSGKMLEFKTLREGRGRQARKLTCCTHWPLHKSVHLYQCLGCRSWRGWGGRGRWK